MRKGLLILTVMILPLLFSGEAELHDGDRIRGDAVSFENGYFQIGGQSIDREEVRRVHMRSLEFESPYDLSVYDLTEEQIAEYRRIAEEMEEKYPVANGYVIRNFSHEVLTNDGRELSISMMTIKIASQDALGWGSYSFDIDEGVNKVDVLFARSIHEDGTVMNFSAEDITYSEPARGEVFFGEGTIMSFTVPGLEVGSIIDVGYIRETYAPEDPELFAAFGGFQYSEPIHNSEFIVEIPKDRDLYYTSQFMDDYFKENWVSNVPGANIPESHIENPTKPEIIETDSSKIYKWVKHDTPPMIREPRMPSGMNVVPLVWTGLHADYEYYHDRFGRIHEDHIQLTPELDSIAHAVIGDAVTDSAKAARIYHWVQPNIRYISVKGALASRFGGHYAGITHEKGYGDCIDKAIIYATLARAVGLRAYPIIVMTNDAGFIHRDKFPWWGGNHAITEVWIDGEPVIIDATNNYYRFPYYPTINCDLWYANYIDRRIGFNPPIDPSYNYMRSQTTMTLDIDGSASIRDSIYFTGDYEAGFRGFFDQTPVDRHQQIIEGMASGRSPGSVLQDFELHNVDNMDNQFSLRFDYDVPRYLQEAGDYYLLEMPAVGYSFPEISLSQRNYPIKLDHPFQRTHDITVEIPSGMTVEFMPDEVRIENKYFDYTARYEKDGNIIRFTDEYNIKEIRIPVEDYEMYKEDAESVMAFVKEKIFLSKEQR